MLAPDEREQRRRERQREYTRRARKRARRRRKVLRVEVPLDFIWALIKDHQLTEEQALDDEAVERAAGALLEHWTNAIKRAVLG